VPVVAVELAAPAQRLFPYPTAPPARFAKLVAGALDDLGIDRAVVSGHSLGSAYASYLAAADARGDLAPRAAAEGEGAGSGGYRRRVGGLVLIDPIACLLHQPGVSSQFIYTPVRSLKEAADDYYFKKELFTATVVSRHLPWHDAALWLEDRAPHTPTLVAVSGDDSIVPAAAVASVFGSWQARLRGVKVLNLPGIGHGGWLGDAVSGERLAEATRALQLESDGAFAVSAKAAASAASAASAATSSAATGLGYALNSTATAIGGGVNATAAAIGGGATGLSSYVGATAAAIGSTFARFPLGDFFVAPPPPPPPSLLDLPTDLLARVVSQSPPLAATAPPPSPRRARVSGSSRPVSGPSRPAGPSSPAARTASRKASTSFRITRTRPASAPKAASVKAASVKATAAELSRAPLSLLRWRRPADEDFSP